MVSVLLVISNHSLLIVYLPRLLSFCNFNHIVGQNVQKVNIVLDFGNGCIKRLFHIL